MRKSELFTDEADSHKSAEANREIIEELQPSLELLFDIAIQLKVLDKKVKS